VSVTNAFKTFQDIVNAVITYVREARARRDLFKGVFGAEDDVKEVVASGSLARGTHKDPIHDVDLIVVYDQDEHPEWGTPGSSAADALDYTRERVNALLGATNGTYEKTVRLARWRNHAVKCFLDDPDDPDAFTVDAMPALRRDGKLLIPEALAEDWVPCDPEFLIAEVADRHAEWNKFAGTVRMLKWWAAEQDTKIKSFVMEVLALDFLPTRSISPPRSSNSSSALAITSRAETKSPILPICADLFNLIQTMASSSIACATRETTPSRHFRLRRTTTLPPRVSIGGRSLATTSRRLPPRPGVPHLRSRRRCRVR